MNELHKKLDQLLGDIKALQDGYQPGDAFTKEDLEKHNKMTADAFSIQETIESTKAADKIAKAAEKVEELPLGGIAKSDQREIVKAWGAMLRDPRDLEAAVEYRKLVKGAQAGNPAQGGAAVVPLVIASEILALGEDSTFVRRLGAKVDTLPFATSLGVVRHNDTTDFSWVQENGAATGGTIATDRRDLSPKRMTRYFDVSNTLLRMVPNFEGEIIRKARYIVNRTEEKAFLTGTGVGQPLGFMVVSANGVDSARVATTAAVDAIAYPDLVQAMVLLDPEYRNGAVWVLSQNAESIVKSLRDDVKRPLFEVGFTGIEKSLGMTLLGLPYVVSKFAPGDALGTANGSLTSNTYPIALANFSAGYRIADAEDIEIVRDDVTQTGTYETRFTIHKHTDGMPVNEEAFVLLKVQ